MEIFGFQITKKGMKPSEKSFIPPPDDGALDTVKSSGVYGTYIDIDGGAKTESELIKRYRDIAMMADVDMAIEDIVNEAIANIEDDSPLTLDLRKLDLTPAIKKKIETEFDYLLKLLDFEYSAQDYFRRWYIDGRIFFHKVIDTKAPQDGIKDIRYIDPRKIKKVRQIEKEKQKDNGVEMVKGIVEYFVYNPQGFTTQKTVAASMLTQTQGIRISKDSIAYAGSGLSDRDNNMVLSYLHYSIKPSNQLRMMENALVIYRLARAPERRIFYIDTGNLPKAKAEQLVKDQMARFRNKLVYDADTGELRDDKKFMSMLDDYWLPRREGSTGTKVETLEGGDNLGEIADIEHFQKKLYQSLHVPLSRIESAGGLNFGRAAEITRDELKFVKFVNKLRRRFGMVFLDLLKTQCILKSIMTEEQWGDISYNIRLKFAQDVYYAESKEQELLRSRLELLDIAAQYEGRYYTREYILKHIMRLDEDQIADLMNTTPLSTVQNVLTPLEPPQKPEKKNAKS